MSKGTYQLTRRALLDLHRIYTYSVRFWGQKTADSYIRDIYASFQSIALKPEQGRLRQKRSLPFLMVPAKRHYVVYEVLESKVIVLTVLHQRRDIETVIFAQERKFLAELNSLKRTMNFQQGKRREEKGIKP